MAENRWSLQDETKFRDWYTGWSKKLGLNSDPDAPEHYYDYRGAYKAGVEPTYQSEHKQYRWPDEFKKKGYPYK